jgi:hypothetical protein
MKVKYNAENQQYMREAEVINSPSVLHMFFGKGVINADHGYFTT